mmetsp:Transcript_41815/g.77696  ORF Transcript_41815/g.77696 Transcript_41815/m.77696 type:complete len:121 (-) Transcript_41815:676-1038(-)
MLVATRPMLGPVFQATAVEVMAARGSAKVVVMNHLLEAHGALRPLRLQPEWCGEVGQGTAPAVEAHGTKAAEHRQQRYSPGPALGVAVSDGCGFATVLSEEEQEQQHQKQRDVDLASPAL